ncbi:MAG: conjugal transfer protein TraG N-terminal domain-containing protein [Pseudobdellovibrionaceae bacterium]|nr:conjugal transfer protein TraG N-terminal domain-containing protein [Pseudobdellovibrionaceae bacterium]
MQAWEIYTYGGGEHLREIFNFLARIFGEADYRDALATAAKIGLLGVLISAAYQRSRLNLQWLIGVLLIYQILIVPKVNVAVVDRLVPANTAVISNVPIGIGITSSFMSTLGDWLTRKFEEHLGMTAGSRYGGSGFLFWQRLVEESTRFEVTSPYLAASLADFYKSCVYYDIMLGLYSWDEMIETKNLVEFFSSKTSQARGFTYQDTTGARSIEICRPGFTSKIARAVEAEVEKSKSIHGARLVGGQSTNDAVVSKFVTELPAAYSYLTKLSLTYSGIISQNILANSLKRGLLNFASDADAPAAAQDFALARAEAERKTTFAVMANVAKKYLPLLKNIFEGFIYALSPIVLIMAMTPIAAQVLSAYAKAIFWVNLWAPLYAILNFYVTRSAATEGATAITGNAFQSGLTIMNNTALGQTMSEMGVIAGYLTLSIPLISWLVVSVSGAVMAGIAGRIVQGYEGPVAGASDEATTGNVSLGNTSINNERSFQVANAPNISTGSAMMRGGDGVSSLYTAGGSVYSTLPTSSAGLSVNFGSSLSAVAKSSYETAQSRETSTGYDVIKANSNLSSMVSQMAQRYSTSESTSSSETSSERQALSQAQANTDRLIDRAAEEAGVTSSGARQIMSDISAGVKMAGTGGSAGYKVSKQLQGSDAYKKMAEFLSSDEYTQSRLAEASAVRNLMTSSEKGYSDSEDRTLKNAMESTTASQSRHSEARRDVESSRQSLENSEQYSAEIQARGLDGFFNWMESSGYSRGELTSMLNSYNDGDKDVQGFLGQKLVEYQKDFMEGKLHDLKGISPGPEEESQGAGDSYRLEKSAGRQEAEADVAKARAVIESRMSSPHLMVPIARPRELEEKGEEIRGNVQTQFNKPLSDRIIESLKE